MMTSTTLAVLQDNRAAATFDRAVAAEIGGLLATLRVWRRRYEWRRELVRFSDHMLSDIGLSRGEAEAEMAKPFWRA